MGDGQVLAPAEGLCHLAGEERVPRAPAEGAPDRRLVEGTAGPFPDHGDGRFRTQRLEPNEGGATVVDGGPGQVLGLGGPRPQRGDDRRGQAGETPGQEAEEGERVAVGPVEVVESDEHGVGPAPAEVLQEAQVS